VIRRGAAVTIRTSRSGPATRIVFSAARRRVRNVAVTLPDTEVLAEARKSLDSRMVELKDAIPGIKVADREAEGVYDALFRNGMLQMLLIFGNRDVLLEIQDFWRRAIPVRDPRNPPLVQCVGDPGAFLPIEYLPVFVPPGAARVRSRAQLVDACRSFVGFSCVVRRSFRSVPVAQGGALRLDRNGRLPVRIFLHDGLPGAVTERRWFEAATDRVDVQAYPGEESDGPGLSDQIWDPAVGLNGATGRMPDQIQHFACHCYATAAAPLENEIEVSGGGRTERVRLDDLGIDLTARHFSRGRRPARMPLVVMNACGASRMAGGGALSFPWLFLRNDNRGFIGSDIEMPDDVAAEFSAAFYTRFIRWREPLGRAFHGARDQLLSTFGNPLGISYSAYADPDLRIHPDTRERP
jgi:hypothetical protein